MRGRRKRGSEAFKHRQQRVCVDASHPESGAADFVSFTLNVLPALAVKELILWQSLHRVGVIGRMRANDPLLARVGPAEARVHMCETVGHPNRDGNNHFYYQSFDAEMT